MEGGRKERKKTNADMALSMYQTLGKGLSHTLLVTSPYLCRIIISPVSQKLEKAKQLCKSGIEELFAIMKMFYILTVAVVTQVYPFEGIYLAKQEPYKSQPISEYTFPSMYIHIPAKP